MESSSIRQRVDKNNSSIEGDELVQGSVVGSNDENNMKRRNPKLAVALSVFIPGLGQAYNAQVMKGIIVFLFFFVITGASLLYSLVFVISLLLGLLFQTGETLLMLFFDILLSPFSNCDTNSSTLCSTLIFLHDKLHSQITTTKALFDHILERLLHFPTPPFTRTIWNLFDDILLDHFFIAASLIGLFFIGTYTYQLYDAYITSKKLNNGTLVILRSRKKQIVQIFTVNIVPYILLLLPIPYVSTFVDVCFSSSKTIENLIDHMGKNSSGDVTISAKKIVWEQLKSLIINKTIEFLTYSLLVLTLIVYFLWYAIRIGFWIASFFIFE